MTIPKEIRAGWRDRSMVHIDRAALFSYLQTALDVLEAVEDERDNLKVRCQNCSWNQPKHRYDNTLKERLESTEAQLKEAEADRDWLANKLAEALGSPLCTSCRSFDKSCLVSEDYTCWLEVAASNSCELPHTCSFCGAGAERSHPAVVNATKHSRKFNVGGLVGCGNAAPRWGSDDA
jgi:hypothetical protein